MAMNFGGATVNNDNRLTVNGKGFYVNDEVIKTLNNLYKGHPEYFTKAEFTESNKTQSKPQQREYKGTFDPSKYTKSTFLTVSEVEQRDKRTFVVSIDWIKSGMEVWKTDRNGKRVIKADLLTIVNNALSDNKGIYDKERKEYIFTTETRAKKFHDSVSVISADRRKAVWASYKVEKKEG